MVCTVFVIKVLNLINAFLNLYNIYEARDFKMSGRDIIV